MQIPEIRREIDSIDAELLALYLKRMELARQIGKLKEEAGLEIYNPAREQEILAKVRETAPKELSSYAELLFSTLFELSRSYQKNNAATNGTTSK